MMLLVCQWTLGTAWGSGAGPSTLNSGNGVYKQTAIGWLRSRYRGAM